jgi:hypothetical protein
MSRSLKAALACILIVSIIGSIFIGALSLPSVAQSMNGSRIYGHVLDKNGHGVDQAEVKLMYDGYTVQIPDNPVKSGDGKKSPYGFYQFNGSYSQTPTIIAAGTYEVTASKGSYSASATVTVDGSHEYSVDLVLADYVQPSVTPVPTATPAATPPHRASATVIDAPPTVIRHVATPDANVTAVPSASPTAAASANVTVTSSPTAVAAANGLPLASPLAGTFFGALAVLCTMALAIRARKD